MNRPIDRNKKQDLTHHKTLSTAELPFAAYIKARYRFPLVDIQKSNGRITWTFEIQDKDEIMLANEFYRGGLVSAAEYFSELKNLKAMTYSI